LYEFAQDGQVVVSPVLIPVEKMIKKAENKKEVGAERKEEEEARKRGERRR
jgi:hypothetical protein